MFSSDGIRVGTVSTVLADDADDIFEGIVISAASSEEDLGERFVDAELVSSIFERGVELSIDAGLVDELPPPKDNSLAEEIGSRDIGGGRSTSVFSRAWKRITGNY